MKTVSAKKERACLRCGKQFTSLSSANRICPACKRAKFGIYADMIQLERDELRELRRISRNLVCLR